MRWSSSQNSTFTAALPTVDVDGKRFLKILFKAGAQLAMLDGLGRSWIVVLPKLTYIEIENNYYERV